MVQNVDLCFLAKYLTWTLNFFNYCTNLPAGFISIMKWRQASGILCDKRVPQKLKGKFYRTAIRPAMLYGAECWPTKRRHVIRCGCCGGFAGTQGGIESGTKLFGIGWVWHQLRRNLPSIGWDDLDMSNEGLLRRQCIMGFLSGSIM